MGNKIYQVDAFAHKPFTGNPAAVCILPGPGLNESWMQDLAREMNLSETAFLYQEREGYRLRWFAPGGEVDLCGHATLASAHVLWEEGLLDSNQQGRFYTKSGLLIAELRGSWIELNFPVVRIQKPLPDDDMALVESALKVKPVFMARNQFDIMVEVDSEDKIRRLDPDMELLKKLPGRGIVVTSRSNSPDYDFVSRFFGPKVGIPEDPVTGSAHCALYPYWNSKLGKQRMIAYQASSRGGYLRVQSNGNRVILGGQAITVLRGELTLNNR
ncbi:MAG: PhzF family phenazine biosynthesis protein [Nitrospirae bacterium]|nr:PhzF family phenazine biosynthesis protein [Nitrospirota bacterium]MBI3594472.1 PhzF family phenazine biosynthesis protein [Nitrospirota bacterium]